MYAPQMLVQSLWMFIAFISNEICVNIDHIYILQTINQPYIFSMLVQSLWMFISFISNEICINIDHIYILQTINQPYIFSN